MTGSIRDVLATAAVVARVVPVARPLVEVAAVARVVA